jgi:hypothetical protein
MSDPFTELGLAADASAADVRRARRELAKSMHPDAGGDADDMRRVNAAAAAALRRLADDGAAPTVAPSPTSAGTAPTSQAAGAPDDVWRNRRRDAPSFTVEALPVETFEALLLAAAELGEVVDDDPPYELQVLLAAPFACWCRLDVVPDAGASTVSLSIAPADGAPPPAIEQVRNAWIDSLNRLDWSQL